MWFEQKVAFSCFFGFEKECSFSAMSIAGVAGKRNDESTID